MICSACFCGFTFFVFLLRIHPPCPARKKTCELSQNTPSVQKSDVSLVTHRFCTYILKLVFGSIDLYAGAHSGSERNASQILTFQC